jgi:hypothetical protein
MSIKIHTIYLSLNTVNGKVYVGYDSKWPSRKNRHEKDAFDEKSKSYNDVFHKSIRKYGKNNFDWCPIYQSLDGIHCLNEMENFFIKQFNSHIYFENSNGYNMTLGGDGVLGLKKNDETKKLHSLKSSKTYKFWYKSNIIEVTNLKKYCVENKISENGLHRITRKNSNRFKYKEYYPYDGETSFDQVMKKYELKIKTSLNVMGEKHSKEYSMIAPNGDLIKFKNLAKFARENNLNPQSLKQVAMGKIKSNKGWSLPKIL